MALPNNLTLIVGGETCSAMTYGTVSGFQCNALNTAELYNETTKAFTFAGSGSGGVMTSRAQRPERDPHLGQRHGAGRPGVDRGRLDRQLVPGPVVPAPSTARTGGQSALHSAELYNPTDRRLHRDQTRSPDAPRA